MTNNEISKKIYEKIENSQEFLKYKKRWIKKEIIFPVLFLILTLAYIFLKSQNIIIEHSIDLNILNILYIINMILIVIFIRSCYKNSYNMLMLNFYLNQKENLNKVERYVLFMYLNLLLEKNYVLKNKKSFFLFLTENILNNIKEEYQEEINLYYNLENF